MRKTLSTVIVMLAALGVLNVPHAIFYEHPELIFHRYMRQDNFPDH